MLSAALSSYDYDYDDVYFEYHRSLCGTFNFLFDLILGYWAYVILRQQVM